MTRRFTGLLRDHSPSSGSGPVWCACEGHPDLGMDVGVIWWPLRRWLALSVRLDYRLTVPISEVEAGFPRHGLGWSMEFVFTL